MRSYKFDKIGSKLLKLVYTLLCDATYFRWTNNGIDDLRKD